MSIREHLQAIYDEHGKLTPRLVLEAARPDDHPLHGHVFALAPDEAAEAWYLHQAHELIQKCKLRYKTDDGHREVREWLAVRSEGPDEYVYEPAEKVAADPLLRQMVLRDMERDWKQLRQRYGHMQEFIDLVGADLALAA